MTRRGEVSPPGLDGGEPQGAGGLPVDGADEAQTEIRLSHVRKHAAARAAARRSSGQNETTANTVPSMSYPAQTPVSVNATLLAGKPEDRPCVASGTDVTTLARRQWRGACPPASGAPAGRAAR